MGVRATRDPLPEAAYKLQPLAGESRSTLALGGSESNRKRGGRRRGGESPAELVNASLKSPRQSNLAPAVGPAPAIHYGVRCDCSRHRWRSKCWTVLTAACRAVWKPSSGFIRSGSPGALNGSRPVGGKVHRSAAIITEWNWTAVRGGGSTASWDAAVQRRSGNGTANLADEFLLEPQCGALAEHAGLRRQLAPTFQSCKTLPPSRTLRVAA